MSFLRTTFVSMAIACVSFLGCMEAKPVLADNTSDEQQEIRLSRASTYYVARLDTRRCAYPRCGGIFVSAVNQTLTVCPRGVNESECYLSDIDFSALTKSPDVEGTVRDAIGHDVNTTRAVLQGTMRQGRMGYGTLVVQMAWVATDRLPIVGDFFRAWDNGVVCVAAPCPSWDQEYLNRGVTMSFHGLLLDDVPGHADDSTFTGPALLSEYGMIVAGNNVVVEDAGPAGEGIFLDASQVFFPVVRRGR